MQTKEYIEKRNKDLESVTLMLRKYVLGMLGPYLKDPEDFLQEITEKLLMKYHLYDPTKAKFTTWCARVTLNHFRDHKRHKQQHFISHEDNMDLEPFEEGKHDYDTAVIFAMIADKCSVDEKRVILMLLEDRTPKSIALELNVKASVINQMIETLKERFMYLKEDL